MNDTDAQRLDKIIREGQASSNEVPKTMSGEHEYKRALQELLEAIEISEEWVTNAHAERVRVVSLGHPNLVSAKREAYAVLGKKVAR